MNVYCRNQERTSDPLIVFKENEDVSECFRREEEAYRPVRLTSLIRYPSVERRGDVMSIIAGHADCYQLC